MFGMPVQDDRSWHDAKEKLLAFTAPEFGNAPCKSLLLRGDLDDITPNLIQENEIDLVVLGTHGLVTKLVMGSDAEKIYRSATCPVLTVGPKIPRKAGDSRTIRRILFPVDLGENSQHALHYALSLAEENESNVILLHSVPMVPWQRASVKKRTQQGLMSLIPPDARDRLHHRVLGSLGASCGGDSADCRRARNRFDRDGRTQGARVLVPFAVAHRLRSCQQGVVSGAHGKSLSSMRSETFLVDSHGSGRNRRLWRNYASH